MPNKKNVRDVKDLVASLVMCLVAISVMGTVDCGYQIQDGPVLCTNDLVILNYTEEKERNILLTQQHENDTIP